MELCCNRKLYFKQDIREDVALCCVDFLQGFIGQIAQNWCVERRLDLSGTYFHDELPFTNKISRQINRTQTKVK